jgi:Holliday junction resolvasome RuvABC endonuclease subunit
MAKINKESIQEFLTPENWSLESEEYKNLDSELVFRCPEGHRVYTTWRKLRTRRECPMCKQNTYKQMEHTVHPKKAGITRFLALDQATNISGVSIYDGSDLVYYASFEAPGAFEAERINSVKEWMCSLIQTWKCDVVGLEGIQYQAQMGVTTFQTLARLQGVLINTCFELGLPYQIAPTNTWRAHCGVKGKARADRKKSMQLLVKNWFDITVDDNCADAIGIGKYISDTYIKKTEVVNWE